MAGHDDWTERTESINGRVRELYARLDGEDRALFHALVGELSDLLNVAKGLL